MNRCNWKGILLFVKPTSRSPAHRGGATASLVRPSSSSAAATVRPADQRFFSPPTPPLLQSRFCSYQFVWSRVHRRQREKKTTVQGPPLPLPLVSRSPPRPLPSLFQSTILTGRI